MKPMQLQDALSAEHGGSAKPVQGFELSQKQEEAADSRRFTPAQQAVAAALMVVMKRATKDCRAHHAKLTLEYNNPATSPFLKMLPSTGDLPTMKQLEQKASDQLLKSLTKLAEQCAAAQCQPLEVFTRSMQCTARLAARERGFDHRGAFDWELWKRQQRMPMPPSLSQKLHLVAEMQQKGVEQSLADLAATYFQLVNVYNDDTSSAPRIASDLNHMLPGVLDTMIQYAAESRAKSPSLEATLLRTLVSSFSYALKAYQMRAKTGGQTFEHVVLLEAAVQGWSLDTPYVGTLLRAMLAAEPPRNLDASSKEEWRKLGFDNPQIGWVMESAFDIATTVGSDAYTATRTILPGLPDERSVPLDYKSDAELGFRLRPDALRVTRQIQVHKYIASVQNISFRPYMEKLVKERGIGGTFLEAICNAAEGISINAVMADLKMMHISMCIKKIRFEDPATRKNRFLALLNHITWTSTVVVTIPHHLTAIRLTLPGLLDCLSELHKWPHGLDKDLEWLAQPSQVIRDIMAQHNRDARKRGITLNEQVRRLLAASGLEDRLVNTTMGAFEEFWAAQDRRINAAGFAQQPNVATFASSTTAAADSNSAEQQLSEALASLGADGSSEAGAAQTLGQQGADRAADVARGAKSKRAAGQADQDMPAEDAQEAAQSKRGLSKGFFLKPKERKAKTKKAQAAGQTAQNKGKESKEPGPAEETGSASQ